MTNSRRRSSRKRKGKSRGASGPVAMGLVATLAIAIIAGATAATNVFAPEELYANMCSVNHAPRASHVLFFDATREAQLTFIQLNSAMAGIPRVAARLGQGDRLTLVALRALDGAGADASMQVIFSRCLPVDPASDYSSWQHGAVTVRETWREHWVKPLSSAVAEVRAILEHGGAATTPMLESLIDIKLDGYLEASETAYLGIYSDLLQHSPGKFSMYVQDFPSVAELQAASWDIVDVEGLLAGVKVDVTMISGDPHHSTRHEEWWMDWFTVADASRYDRHRF